MGKGQRWTGVSLALVLPLSSCVIHPWELAYGCAKEQGERDEPTHRLKLGLDDLPRETALSEAAGEGQTSL